MRNFSSTDGLTAYGGAAVGLFFVFVCLGLIAGHYTQVLYSTMSTHY